MLARPPREISLAQVIGALEGPIGMTECSSAPGLCLQESGCSIRTNWQRINRVILQALERITLEDMTRPIGRAVEVSMIKAPGIKAPGSGQRLHEAGPNRPPAGAQR